MFSLFPAPSYTRLIFRYVPFRFYLPSSLLTFLIHVLAPSVAFFASRYGTRGVILICRDKRQARRNNLNDFYIEGSKKSQTLNNNL